MPRSRPEKISRSMLLATVLAVVAIAAGGYGGWTMRRLMEVLIGGGAAAALQGWLAPGWRDWRRWAGVLLGWAIAAGLVERWFPTGGELKHAGYVLAVGFLLGALVNAVRDETHGWREDWRIAALLVSAVWLFRPYLTSDFFGGVDARSYGYAMTDTLQQARAGVFPVFVGQSEYMFNGAIHPIRTAPYHQYLGLLLDLLTGRALRPLAIQHLTVVWTAIQGALTCYFCLTWLEPKRRGLAWLLSFFYVSAPAAAAAVYGQEMYMTYMTYAYLPWVIWANVRLTQTDGLRHGCALAAGLAVVWFCHPPVATWLSLATLGWQGLRLLTLSWSVGSWRRMVVAGVLFAALTAGYFWSMVEATSQGHLARDRSWLLASAAVALAVFALTRALAGGKKGWGWLVGAGGLSFLVFRMQPFLGRWLAAAVLAATILLALEVFRPGWRWRDRVPESLVLLLLLSGVVTSRWLPTSAPGGPATAWVERLWPQVYRPVSSVAQLPGDVQLGYVLLAAAALSVIVLWRTQAPERRLLGLASGVGLLLCLPVPGVTRFIFSLLPEPIYALSGDIAWFRYLPTVTVLATFAGFLALTSWNGSGGGRRVLLLLIAVAGIAWNLSESEKFVRCGYRNVNTRETIDAFYRTENARQFAYIFAGMPVSPYLTNGVVDYHLESRLLQADDPTKEIPLTWSEGPEAEAKSVTFTTTVDDASPYWLHLAPKLELQPGEHLLLQFEFFDRPYEGILVCRGSEGFYREYPLPTAGFFEKSFGTAPERPKTIALWNDGTRVQPVEMFFLQSALPPNGLPFGNFARVVIRHYQPAQLPIRTLALVPAYQAETTLAAPAYLETPRAYLPGYRAVINGHDAAVEPSPNHMAMIKLAAGSNRVELRYTGTTLLRRLMLLSLASWLGLGIVAWRVRRREPNPVAA